MARLNPKERKEQILQAAIQLAEREGYANIRRDDVASAANVSAGLVNQYFNTMAQLKRAIMRRAVRDQILAIVAQGLIAQDRLAANAPDDLKHRALNVYCTKH